MDDKFTEIEKEFEKCSDVKELGKVYTNFMDKLKQIYLENLDRILYSDREN